MIYNTDNQEKRTSKPIKLYDGFCNEYIVELGLSGELIIKSRNGEIKIDKISNNSIKLSTDS